MAVAVVVIDGLMLTDAAGRALSRTYHDERGGPLIQYILVRGREGLLANSNKGAYHSRPRRFAIRN